MDELAVVRAWVYEGRWSMARALASSLGEVAVAYVRAHAARAQVRADARAEPNEEGSDVSPRRQGDGIGSLGRAFHDDADWRGDGDGDGDCDVYSDDDRAGDGYGTGAGDGVGRGR